MPGSLDSRHSDTKLPATPTRRELPLPRASQHIIVPGPGQFEAALRSRNAFVTKTVVPHTLSFIGINATAVGAIFGGEISVPATIDAITFAIDAGHKFIVTSAALSFMTGAAKAGVWPVLHDTSSGGDYMCAPSTLSGGAAATRYEATWAGTIDMPLVVITGPVTIYPGWMNDAGSSAALAAGTNHFVSISGMLSAI